MTQLSWNSIEMKGGKSKLSKADWLTLEKAHRQWLRRGVKDLMRELKGK